MENSADFGMTQLPVEEKRLQVVNISPRRNPADRAGATIRWPTGQSVTAQDVTDYFLVLPKYGKTRTRLNEWLEAGGRRHSHLHGAGFHRDDEALRDGGPGCQFRGGVELPGRDRGRQTESDPAGAGTDDAAAGPDLSQGQGAFQSGARIYPGGAGNVGEEAGTAKEKPKPRGWSPDDVPPLPKKIRRRLDTRCPHCGDSESERASGMFQTSTVLISTSGTDQVYRSVDEVPAGCAPGC